MSQGGALDDLLRVVDVLRLRINDYSTELQEETRTRVSLINPLLQALGWDASDPSIVRLEYGVRNRRADYALLLPDKTPIVALEAKRLGEPFHNHLEQMLTYANMGGIKYAGITDGDHWELYDVFTPGDLDRRRMLDVTLTKMEGVHFALSMLLLLRPNVQNDPPLSPGKPLVLQKKKQQSPSPPPLGMGWTNLPQVETTGKVVESIRFPDSKEKGTASWRSVLTYTAEWLAEKQYLTDVKTPVSGTKSRSYILNIGNVNKSGKPFRAPGDVGGTHYKVETHASAVALLRSTCRLLQHCGIDPSSVHLRVHAR